MGSYRGRRRHRLLGHELRRKGQAGVEALDKYDIVCVHVEATDEASHEGRYDEKVKALESIDTHVVGPILEKLQSMGEYRLLVLPDHPTPCSTKKHSHGMVPLAVCGTGIAASGASYDEIQAAASPLAFSNGWEMMEAFIRGKWPGNWCGFHGPKKNCPAAASDNQPIKGRLMSTATSS